MMKQIKFTLSTDRGNDLKPITAKKLLLITAMLCSAASPCMMARTADSLYVDKTYPIDEIVVTGTRNDTDLRHLPMTISVLSKQQIEAGHEPSLLPTLTERIPGLFVTGRGVMGYGVSTGAAGGMTMRGVGGNPTTGMLVLIDGHPQYMGLMGHPIADAYQSMLAEKVEVVRGPASVLYGGNAMGGVINIVTRKSSEEGMGGALRAGYGSYNTLQTELAGNMKSGRWSGIATGSYNRTDGHRADMGFEQYGGYAKAGYEIDDHWSVFADANITRFNASNPGSITAPVLDNDSRITRGMTSLAVQNRYERTSGAVNLFYNWGEHYINDGYSPGGTPLDYRFHSHDRMMGLSVYQSISLGMYNRLTAGFDYQHFGGRAWNTFQDGAPNKELADKTMYNMAGYVDFRQTVGRMITFDAGVRLDRNSHVGTEWVPQAGISFHLDRHTDIKATVGKGFRFPTIREMYMFPPQNPDLKPERLMNYELSFKQRRMDASLSYGLNLFHIAGENMIMRVPVNGRPMNVNTGKIKNWGIECNIDWAIDRMWSLTANYSYLRMKYPVLAAPENKLYCGADFTLGRLRISTGIQYIAGLYTSVKPETKENFMLWNANASYRIVRSVELYVRGENLLSERYEINAGYPMPQVNVIGGLNINF